MQYYQDTLGTLSHDIFIGLQLMKNLIAFKHHMPFEFKSK